VSEVVLGLWDGHDGGAAVCVDGLLVAAISQERVGRIKQQGGWPTGAIEQALAGAGIGPAEVDKVALAGTTGRLPARVLDGRYASRPPQREDPLAWPVQLYGAYQNRIATRRPLRSLEKRGSRAVAEARLRQRGIRAPVTLVDHHLAHARGALAALGGGPGLVVTMDGYGDGVSTAVWRAETPDSRGRSALTKLDSAGTGASLALLYGALNRTLGFAPGEEGKVTGLATQADGTAVALERFIGHRDGRVQVARRRALAAMKEALAAGTPRAGIAAALQRALEEAVVAAVGWHLARTGLRRLAVAGGLFANVALNGRLAALDLDAFAVFAAMGDQGLCAGAAWAVGEARCELADMHVGGEPGPVRGGAVSGPAEPAAVAARLADGELIGVCRGRMEFGPRALGHRSILAHAGRADAAARLAEGLRRPDFMPFAPLLGAAAWADAFDVPLQRVARAAAEMTLALPVRPAFAARIPAAVAADATARPQVLDAQRDPWLAAVLAAFSAQTGCPALINTSFNRHREPIVRTAAEALDAGRAVGLDAVVIDESLIAAEPLVDPAASGDNSTR